MAGNTIGRYKLLLEDFEGKVCPLVYDVGSSAAVNAPVETRKLKLNGLMLYYNIQLLLMLVPLLRIYIVVFLAISAILLI